VVPVADSSDEPITTETELEDLTDNALAVSESEFLFLPSPSSLCTVNTGMSGLGCPKTLYGYCSHLSASLCFSLKATIFTRTRSPTLIVAII
jgi:hypothetical protein